MEIKISAPEIVNALDTLSNVMDRLMKQIVALEEQGPCPSQIVDVPAETITQEEGDGAGAPGPAKVVSKEEVIARLGVLVAGGKQAELKALLAKFGAAKMSEVPAEKRAELLAAAEAI